MTVESLVFTERAGIPPRELLPVAIASADPDLRRYGVRMLARSDLPADERASLAGGVAADPDLDVRFAAAHTLRRSGQAFLANLSKVLEEGEEALKQAARRLAGREAAEGARQAELVIGVMSEIRRAAAAKGDEAMFALPVGALVHVVPLLGDPELGQEARAVLFTARQDGLPALDRAWTQGEPNVRRGAFQVGYRLVEEGVLPLESYLGRVRAESDASVQARGLEPFQAAPLAPTQLLTEWVLRFLRESSPQAPADAAAQAILSRVGQGGLPAENPGTVEELIEDLTKAGDHSAVLAELAGGPRLFDLQIDEWITARWKKLEDGVTKRRVIDLLQARPYESAQRTILEGVEDEDPEVRAYAVRALLRPKALRSDRFRRDAARVVGRCLRKEEDPLVRQRLFDLAEGKHICGRYPSDDKPAKHTCAEPIISYLRGQAKAGDRAALRCLSTHPSQQAIDSLLEVIGGARELQLRSDAIGELNNLTGLGRAANDAAAWQRELRARQEQVDRRLREQAEREREGILRINLEAERRAQEISERAKRSSR